VRETSDTRPPRVEQAFELLPALDVLAPLGASVLAASEPDPEAHWSASQPYLTLGKWRVDAAELRRLLPTVIQEVGRHVASLYDSYATALEAQRRGDLSSVVEALSSAGEREELFGRARQARAWYDAALGVAETLVGRRPEIEVLLAIGGLESTRGRLGDAARAYQRALALAGPEGDAASLLTACLGLGDASLAQGSRESAAAWYERAETLVPSAGDERSTARLERQQGLLARSRGDWTGARRYFGRARRRLARLNDASSVARVLVCEGRVASEQGSKREALATLTEALAWARELRVEDPELEVEVRLRLAELHLSVGRQLEAEDEMRRAEAVAIGGTMLAWLVRIYTRMGVARGAARDGGGFVFFEQALELCRRLGHPPLLEARVFRAYGEFRSRLGDHDEARAYMRRAAVVVEAEREALRPPQEWEARLPGSGAVPVLEGRRH